MQLIYENFVVEGNAYELASFVKNLNADEIRVQINTNQSEWNSLKEVAVPTIGKTFDTEFSGCDCPRCFVEKGNDFSEVLEDILAIVSAADMDHQEKFDIMEALVYFKENHSA